MSRVLQSGAAVQSALLPHAIALAKATTREHFQAGMASALDVIGAKCFGVSMLASDRQGTRPHYSHQAIPGGYDEHVSNLVSATTDPIMQHCRTSPLPIAWDRATYASRGLHSHWQRMASFGLGQGAALALHLDRSRHFMIGVDWDRTSSLTSDQAATAIASVQTLAVFAEPAAQRICNQLQAQSLEQDTNLSPRELECLFWVGRGMTDQVIARILTISPHTVRKHVEGCVRKLQASNRTEAAVTATRLGLTLNSPTRTFDV